MLPALRILMRILPRKALLPCLVAALALACGGGSSSAPPSQSNPGGSAGGPRLAWDQFAPSAEELRQYSFVLYVDGALVALPGASCGTLAADTLTAPCLAPLPAIAPGQHTLAMATRVTRDGVVLESERSASILYPEGATGFSSGSAGATVVGTGTGAGAGTTAGTAPDAGAAGGLSYVVETVVRGLDRPSGLAQLPDGRLLIAERGGRIRIAEGGELAAEPAVLLPGADPADDARISLAVALDFSSSRHVFAAYGAIDAEGTRSGRIIRFREAGGTLGEPAVIVDGLPAALAAPWVRIGPDQALYVATCALDAQEAEDLGSYAGKILRFALDGTIPPDSPIPSSPIYSWGQRGRLEFDWDPGAGSLWFVESGGGAATLGHAPAGQPGARAADLGTVRASGVAFQSGGQPAQWRGSIFVAAPDEECLLRVSGVAAARAAPSVERVLSGQFGRITALLSAGDGLYFATANGPAAGSSQPVDVVYRICDNPMSPSPWRRNSP